MLANIGKNLQNERHDIIVGSKKRFINCTVSLVDEGAGEINEHGRKLHNLLVLKLESLNASTTKTSGKSIVFSRASYLPSIACRRLVRVLWQIVPEIVS